MAPAQREGRRRIRLDGGGLMFWAIAAVTGVLYIIVAVLFLGGLAKCGRSDDD